MLVKALGTALYILASSFIVVSVTPLARQGQPEWFPYLLFAFGILGALGAIGWVYETRWGKHCAVLFGACVFSIFFDIANLSAGIRLLAFVIGIVIVYWVLNSYPVRVRHGPSEAENHIDIERRLHAATGDGSDNIEALRYNLEREKLLWDVIVRHRENHFFNRNFGVIITAIVSFAAVVVSFLQLTISLNNARAQIDNESLKNDRQFYLEIAKFLLDRRQELAATDNTSVIYLRNVVLAAFPSDAAIQIATNMRDMANTRDVRAIWEDGLRMLQARKSAPSSRLAPR